MQAKQIVMDRIYLKNIRTYSNHGCMEEEAKIGSDYLVNVVLTTNFEQAAKTDKLEDTVDYVAINRLVKEEMAIRSKLLEHVLNRILLRIMKEHKAVTKAVVKVAKQNPPINGDVEEVAVERELMRNKS